MARYNIVCCIVLGLLCTFSCRTPGEKDKINAVKAWLGKKVEFPENKVFTRFCKDTITELPCTNYIIVNYIDSVGCIGCKLQALEWKGFMDKLASVSSERVLLLFYIQAKETKELMWMLRGDDFDYPICFDESGTFRKTNALPPDTVFGTFLLNADKEVVLIGSPIGNHGLEELYMETLGSQRTN